MSRSLRRVCVLLAFLLSISAVSTVPASANAESEFVFRTNSARSASGLPAYAVRSDLAYVARRQAARMAAAGRIYHNPNLGSDVGNWRALGENVGSGTSVSAIHNAFMNSASHRENILSSVYTELGVGTATGADGQIYVSEVFRQPEGAAAPAPVYVAPAAVPHRVTPRASRSARRVPLAPALVVVPVKRVPTEQELMKRNLRSAWLLYRRDRPIGSFQRVAVFYRTQKVLAG